jgi:hypothetical protein
MTHILTEHEKKVNNVSSYEELVEREMKKIERHIGDTIHIDSTGKITTFTGCKRQMHPNRKTGIIKITCHCQCILGPEPTKKTEPVKKEATKKTEPVMKEPTKKTEPVKKESNITHKQLDSIIKQIKFELSQGFADMSSQIEASTDYIATLQRK